MPLLGGLTVLYYGVGWFFPWELFQVRSTISVSYLWDLVFAIICGLLYGLNFRAFNSKGVFVRFLAISGLASISILALQLSAVKVPFKFLELPFLQLLILAPLVEEIVFRYAFLGAYLQVLQSKNKALLISSLLFSLSHLPGMWHLPEEFGLFVLIQLVYTFFMGWIIGKARIRTGGVLEPIGLHFIFNLFFYIAVVNAWI